MPFIKLVAVFSLVSLLVLGSATATPKHVFLSFRGRETRTGFTGHLYAALDRAGIPTFIDEVGIRRGRNIYSEIERAINESIMSIILFSKRYATSTYCLDEVVMIMERRRTGELLVVPIFYKVSPDEVREQTGRYGEAFAEHEKQFKAEIHKIEEWRGALREVADLAGMVLKDGQSEVKFIEEIVEVIRKELNNTVRNDATLRRWNRFLLIRLMYFLLITLTYFLLASIILVRNDAAFHRWNRLLIIRVYFLVGRIILEAYFLVARIIPVRNDAALRRWYRFLLITLTYFFLAIIPVVWFRFKFNVLMCYVQSIVLFCVSVLESSLFGTTGSLSVSTGRRDAEAFTHHLNEALIESGIRTGTTESVFVSIRLRDEEAFTYRLESGIHTGTTDSVFVGVGGRDAESFTHRLKSGIHTGTIETVFVSIGGTDAEAFIHCGIRIGTTDFVSVSIGGTDAEAFTQHLFEALIESGIRTGSTDTISVRMEGSEAPSFIPGLRGDTVKSDIFKPRIRHPVNAFSSIGKGNTNTSNWGVELEKGKTIICNMRTVCM